MNKNYPVQNINYLHKCNKVDMNSIELFVKILGHKYVVEFEQTQKGSPFVLQHNIHVLKQ